ncbi:MAG: polyribonucleotide nucleotidyltransferase [Kiritimatiellae bacterium]|nr:polyribonucleotide nucleotidyltransferase [Kiritimatiellia bacterium]
MENTTKVSAIIGGKEITIETGLLARQAAGSVTVRLADTVLFSAVCHTDAPREGIDYFPLQVDYREKFYAAGQYPGGYFKRESRPSDHETLIARLTDRPIRPLFPEGYYNDVQIMNMLLSADGENDPDVLSVTAASAALHLSEVPFYGPIAAVRIGRINGEWVINPTQKERLQSDLDLMYAGTRDRFLMMEGGADEIPEADFIAAMKRAQEEVVKLIDIQIELRRMLGKPDKVITEIPQDPEKMDFLRSEGAELRQALMIPGKLERQGKVDEIKAALKVKVQEKWPEFTDNDFLHLFDAYEIETVRSNVLDHNHRIDGRGQFEIRPLSAQVHVLPRPHGSAIFMRGETQSLGTVTLGTKSDAQEMDAITGGAKSKRFMLHYNFPPYCTGEVRKIGGTGRREIGHGALAERSLRPVIPEDYPYTIRVVSDIMGSNGSSSMASVCVGTLALMDAGVPIKAPVAGISAGLFTTPDESKKVVVTDILGAEDHCGDMDFKVCGTRKGITGFQVDLKIRGLTWDIVEEAIRQTRDARMKILDFIESVLPAPRAELSPYAPRIETVIIPQDKIGALIGKGGETIRGICDTTGAQIDIEEEGDKGIVTIFATAGEMMEAAKKAVNAVIAEPEEGMIYEGTVTGIKDFGAFVKLTPAKDGLLHISRVANGRVGKVEDVLNLGDIVKVKVLEIDPKTGKISLDRLDKPEAPEGSSSRRSDEPKPGRSNRGERRPRRTHEA